MRMQPPDSPIKPTTRLHPSCLPTSPIKAASSWQPYGAQGAGTSLKLQTGSTGVVPLPQASAEDKVEPSMQQCGCAGAENSEHPDTVQGELSWASDDAPSGRTSSVAFAQQVLHETVDAVQHL